MRLLSQKAPNQCEREKLHRPLAGNKIMSNIYRESYETILETSAIVLFKEHNVPKCLSGTESLIYVIFPRFFSTQNKF